jgi:hypothetical protein
MAKIEPQLVLVDYRHIADLDCPEWEGANRPLDSAEIDRLAADLRESANRSMIPASGFNNPIMLMELTEEDQFRSDVEGKHFKIIAGRHRYAAWIKARLNTSRMARDITRLECLVYRGISNEQALYLRLTENLHRSELKPAERKRWAAMVGRARAKMMPSAEEYQAMVAEKNARAEGEAGVAISTIGANSAFSTNGSNSAESPRKGVRGPKADPWFTDWQTETRTPKQTALNWWHEFVNATGRKGLVPGKADKATQEAFFEFHAAQAEREAAAERAAEERRAKDREVKIARFKSEIERRVDDLLSLIGSSATNKFLTDQADRASAWEERKAA